MRKGEFWLKIVGIGLMLFGVSFGFKYSIEQGWVNPLVRHLFGLAIGTGLLVIGLRLYKKRPGFAQVLLGGSIGAYYITCFSAFQLFQLISHPVAFGGMILISAASFWIAIRQDEAIFSLIGTAGALGTPFMLYTGSGNLPGLVLYTCLVLVSTTAVYFFKGWRLLLWLSVAGSWIVLGIGIEGGDLSVSAGADSDRWAMQAGLILAWLTFWLAPVGRRVARIKASARWKTGLLGIGDSGLADTTRQFLDNHVHLMAIGPVVAALLLSLETWPGVEDYVFGWSAMGAAVLYALVALYLNRTEPLRNLAFTHTTVSTMLFTLGLWFLLEGETLLFVMATEAVVLHLVARRLSDQRIALGGHALFGGIGLWLFVRLIMETNDSPAFFNAQALVDLWTIACGAATAFIVRELTSRRAYLIVAAIALAMLFSREFSGDLLFFLLTLETAAFYVLARRRQDEIFDVFSQAAWGGVAIHLMIRLTEPAVGNIAFFNWHSLTDLFVVACYCAVAFLDGRLMSRRIYLILTAVGLGLLFSREFSGDLLFFLITLEIGAFCVLAHRLKDEALDLVSHMGWGGLAIYLGSRLAVARTADLAVFNLDAAVNLLPLLLAVGASFWLTDKNEKRAYQMVVHFGFLAWLAHELLPLENGQGLVSIAWGLYGAILLIAGLRRNLHALRLVGLGTLMLVVAKLFMVDLARLETIWRVLLFVGFGGVFLALSYYFPKLWKKDAGAEGKAGE